MRGYCFLPQLPPFLILALCLSLFFSFCSRMDIGGKYTKYKVTFACCASGRIDNSERPPSRCLSPSHSLWWKPGCHISLIREARWKAASKKLRGTMNFIICPLFTYKLSFTTNHQTAQDKQTSLRGWGRKRCVRRGKEITSIYQTFLCSINSWGIYSTYRFPRHSVAGGMPTARDYKAKGRFIL